MSNATFKNNTASFFRHPLIMPLELTGDWEAGLREIHFPNSWWNVYQPIKMVAIAGRKHPTKAFNSSKSNEKFIEKVYPMGGVQQLSASTNVVAMNLEPVKKDEGDGEEDLPLQKRSRVYIDTGEVLAKFAAELKIPLEEAKFILPITWAFGITRAHYQSPDELVGALRAACSAALFALGSKDREAIFLKNEIFEPYIEFMYSMIEGRIQISTNITNLKLTVESGHDVLRKLGFEDLNLTIQPPLKIYTAPSPIKAHFGNIGAFVVYWDAVEYSVIGDYFAPVLAIVNPSTKAGEYSTCERFENPVFHRLTKSYINEVEFSIKLSTGEPADFNQIGQTVLVVEYRKIWPPE